MSDDRLQRALNDYLDDRLNADERKRFEERVAGDEELARRLATAREIRAELRGGAEELSPAFYTRTVARFSAQRRRLPFGLSWSTAGLAVATIAVAAIFVPSVLREEIPDMPATPQAQEQDVRLPEESRPEKIERAAADAESSLESLGYVTDERAPAEQAKDDLVGRESVDTVEPPVKNLVGGLAGEDRKRKAANEPMPAPPVVAQQPQRQIAELEEQGLGRGQVSEGDPADALELNAKLGRAERVDASEFDKMCAEPAFEGFYDEILTMHG